LNSNIIFTLSSWFCLALEQRHTHGAKEVHKHSSGGIPSWSELRVSNFCSQSTNPAQLSGNCRSLLSFSTSLSFYSASGFQRDLSIISETNRIARQARVDSALVRSRSFVTPNGERTVAQQSESSSTYLSESYSESSVTISSGMDLSFPLVRYRVIT